LDCSVTVKFQSQMKFHCPERNISIITNVHSIQPFKSYQETVNISEVRKEISNRNGWLTD